MNKKVILGIMILLLVGVLLAQSTFATSLISIGGDNNTVAENNTTENNTTNTANTSLTPANLGTNNNTGLNNSLGGNYSYSKTNNTSSLPQTGLNNTVLIVLSVVALVAVVVTFKKMSDYGNI